MSEQGYVLYIGNVAQKEDAVIAIAGVGPAGAYFGLQTLKQLTAVRAR